jgi:hypothetical protein
MVPSERATTLMGRAGNPLVGPEEDAVSLYSGVPHQPPLWVGNVAKLSAAGVRVAKAGDPSMMPVPTAIVPSTRPIINHLCHFRVFIAWLLLNCLHEDQPHASSLWAVMPMSRCVFTTFLLLAGLARHKLTVS